MKLGKVMHLGGFAMAIGSLAVSGTVGWVLWGAGMVVMLGSLLVKDKP